MGLGRPGAKRRTAKRLTDLAIADNSGVDRPAHRSPGWAVRKDAAGDPLDDRIADVIDRLEKQLGDEQEDEPMDELIKALNGAKGKLPEGAQPLLDQLTKALSGEKVEDSTAALAAATEATKAAEARATAAETEAARLRKAIAGGDDKPTETEVLAKALGELPGEAGAVIKAAIDGLQERVTKAETEVSEARKAADDERDARLSTEYLAKAADFTGLPAKPETLATVLRHVDEGKVTKDDAAEISRLLKAASNLLTSGDGPFGEIGGIGADATDEQSQVEAQADELQKADAKLSRSEAIVKAADMLAARNGKGA